MSINITDNQDLLIEQWKLAPRFNALLDGITSLMQRQMVDPLCDIHDQRVIDNADGVFLDYIGQRLGLPRAYYLQGTAVDPSDFFGYEGVGESFDQAPFRPAQDFIVPEGSEPQSDGEYREDLRVRGCLINLGASVDDLNTATASMVSGSVTFLDTPAGISAIHSVTKDRLDSMIDRGVIQLPAGRGLSSSFDISGGVPQPVQRHLVISDDIVGRPAFNQVLEGQTRSMTVRLNGDPGEPVLMTTEIMPILGEPDLGFTLGGATTILFTPSDWNVERVITLTARRFNDHRDKPAQLILRTQSTRSANRFPIRFLNKADTALRPIVIPPGPDTTGTITPGRPPTASNIVVSESTSVEIDPGASRAISVRLSNDPGEQVIVRVTPSDPSITLSGATTMIFNSENWGDDQIFIVTAPNRAGEKFQVFLTAQSSQTNPRIDLSFTIASLGPPTPTQPVARNLVVSTGSTLSVDEGSIRSVSVRLDGDPGETVRVNITETDDDIALSGATSMTFTSDNWNTDQFFTIAGVPDSDTSDDAAAVLLTATSTQTNSAFTISVTVIDSEAGEVPTPQTLVLSDPTTISINEGESEAIGVRLSGDPRDIVAVRVTETSEDIELSGTTTMTFDTSNWNTQQFFVVSALRDTDQSNETARFTVTATGLQGVTNHALTVTVNILDMTQAPTERGLVLNATSPISIQEGGARGITVRLDGDPGEVVTVTATESDDDINLTGSTTMTFDSGNWNNAQLFTINTMLDPDRIGDTADVTLIASSAETNLTQTLVVNIVDTTVGPMARNLVIDPQSPYALDEGDNTMVSVRLDGDPREAVTVTASETSALLTLGGATTMVFNELTWNIPQTFIIAATRDSDLLDNSANVSLIATSEETNLTETLVVNINDTTPAPDINLVVSAPTNLELGEGESLDIQVRLDGDPLGTMNATVVADNDAASLSGATAMTFNSSNWQTDQTFTITGAVDADDDHEEVNITIAATREDNGETVVHSVRLLIFDAGGVARNLVIAPEAPLRVRETFTETVSVRLDGDPREVVNVAIASDADFLALAGSLAMRFDSTNWSTPQTFSVRALADADLEHETGDVTLTMSSMASNQVITYAVEGRDDEHPEAQAVTLVLSDPPGPITIVEGQNKTFTVRLNRNPGFRARGRLQDSLERVTVVVRVTHDRGLSLPGGLTSATHVFDANNWDTDWTFVLSSTADRNIADEVATLRLTSTGLQHPLLTSETVEYTVTVDDTTVHPAPVAGGRGYLTTFANSRVGLVDIRNDFSSYDVTLIPASVVSANRTYKYGGYWGALFYRDNGSLVVTTGGMPVVFGRYARSVPANLLDNNTLGTLAQHGLAFGRWATTLNGNLYALRHTTTTGARGRSSFSVILIGRPDGAVTGAEVAGQVSANQFIVTGLPHPTGGARDYVIFGMCEAANEMLFAWGNNVYSLALGSGAGTLTPWVGATITELFAIPQGWSIEGMEWHNGRLVILDSGRLYWINRNQADRASPVRTEIPHAETTAHALDGARILVRV